MLYWCVVVSLLGVGHASLMSRIGLRLGSKAVHQHHNNHKARVPWAVRLNKEENGEEGFKSTRIRDYEEDEENRAPPYIGICYYNKLMALEAKEDLTRHNLVYKQ